MKKEDENEYEDILTANAKSSLSGNKAVTGARGPPAHMEERTGLVRAACIAAAL